MATGRGKHGEEDKTEREHDNCFMAVHKVTGKYFGGKAAGTHVGYSKIGPLKQAMTLAQKNHDDYFFVKISFTEGAFSQPTPTFTYVQN